MFTCCIPVARTQPGDGVNRYFDNPQSLSMLRRPGADRLATHASAPIDRDCQSTTSMRVRSVRSLRSGRPCPVQHVHSRVIADDRVDLVTEPRSLQFRRRRAMAAPSAPRVAASYWRGPPGPGYRRPWWHRTAPCRLAATPPATRYLTRRPFEGSRRAGPGYRYQGFVWARRQRSEPSQESILRTNRAQNRYGVNSLKSRNSASAAASRAAAERGTICRRRCTRLRIPRLIESAPTHEV